MNDATMSMEQKNQLEAPLDLKHVRKPTGDFGPKGDYIEGWHAIAEANRIFGYNGWSYTVISCSPCHEPYQNAKGNNVVGFLCTIEVTALGVTRQDVGYGSGASKQIGDAYEGAAKEAVTDALKRALRSFGNQFGLALYDKARANVTDGKQKTSAAQMKRGLEAIDKDLVDTKSPAALATLESEWRGTITKEAWSKDYALIAREKFDTKAAQLETEQEAA